MKQQHSLIAKFEKNYFSEGWQNSRFVSTRRRNQLSFLSIVMFVGASEVNAAPLDLSHYPLFIGSINKANVLLILDNSNSMDEDPDGEARCDASSRCGSASDTSKSQIAREAAKSLITTYTNKINMGLMAYQQNPANNTFGNHDTSVVPGILHSLYYDISFNPANYDASFNGNAASTTKRSRRANPTNPGTYTYYNLASPTYYSAAVANAFCYSQTAPAAAFGSPPLNAGTNCDSATGCEQYRCFSTRTGQTDAVPVWNNAASEAALGYSNWNGQYFYTMDDAELARGIYDIGRFWSWHFLGNGWFSRTSPGRGYLHTPIALLDNTQATKLNTKLGRSQFVTNAPTNPAQPLQNAGLTPIEGTFITAKDYFLGNLTQAGQGGGAAGLTKATAQGGPVAAPPNSCGKNFTVYLTDGLPSTNANGTAVTVPATALTNAATAISNLRTSGATVESYIIGFALPYGADPATLNTLAAAGDIEPVVANKRTAYSASDLTSLNATFNSIFTDILAKTGSAASVATNSTNLKTESRVFQAKFASTDWSGQLLQYQINDLTTPEWDTGSKINAQTANSRVIITKGATDGIPFRWTAITTDLTASQQTDLNQDASGTPDALGISRVNYLRGDATNELTAANPGGTFRARASKLGDIVNSNPWFVGPPSAGYSDVDHSGYTAFKTGALSSRKPVVYVGGNDGMLHGIDASLSATAIDTDPLVDSDGDGNFTNDKDYYPPTSTAGNEVLAYIPSAVYPNLSKLTGLTYNNGQNHRYFVDSSPMVGDAYSDSAWRSTLIGALGAGGKGFYALDITDPAGFSETGTAPQDILLWEFTDISDSDVGYVYNNPPAHENGQAKQIIKMANGKWAAILGNGYNSALGKAALYILFIGDGIDGTWGASDYVKITADVPVNQDNGLSTPVPFDSNGDGYVDTVYAGDLKGNMWKFLVGPNVADATVTADPATWKLALSTAGCTTNCTPLFSAKDSGNTAQPIIWPPEVTIHPDGGMVVLFGTGKYLEPTDNGTSGVQTLYSIRDEGTPISGSISGRVDLNPKLISTTTIGANTYRTMSPACGANPLPACPNVSKGCYADLPTSRERATGIPKLDSGTIFFNTFIPTAGQCTSGGTGWLMALDYLNCGLPVKKVFDTTNDGYINSSDTIVSGMQIGGALGGTTLIKSAKPGESGVGVSSLVTGELVTTALNLGAGSRGRINWREIVQ
jgi:type IV pilus assembly protein PilY1